MNFYYFSGLNVNLYIALRLFRIWLPSGVSWSLQFVTNHLSGQLIWPTFLEKNRLVPKVFCQNWALNLCIDKPQRFICIKCQSITTKFCASYCSHDTDDCKLSRGGVEDTRLEAKAKGTQKFRGQDPLEAKTQGRRCKCSKKKVFNLKKKVFKNFFQAKKVFKNFFQAIFTWEKTKKGRRKFSARFLSLSNKLSTVQKIVLSSSRGQGYFRGLEASRPMPRPRTSKSVLEVKNVLEDSTSEIDTVYCLCAFVSSSWP